LQSGAIMPVQFSTTHQGKKAVANDRRIPKPEIRTYPLADQDFQTDVQATIARSRQRIRAGHRLLETVRRDLANRYPSIAIHEQDSLASVDDTVRWYVYRDGRIA
jgi:hypothetical protein